MNNLAEQIAETLDRERLKGLLTKWRFIAAILFIGLLINIISSSVNYPRGELNVHKDSIGRIDIDDLILYEPERLAAIEKIATHHHIKAVILHINSPGGEVFGSESLYHALRKLGEKKPLVAVMDGVAASGGYMIATSAERIFASASTSTGSIGVVVRSYEVTELAQKLGIGLNTFKTSQYKASMNTFEKVTPEVEEAIKEQLTDVQELFLNIVQERRKIEMSKLQEIANGKVYLGKRALALKLIDEIGDEESALKWLQSAKGIDKALDVKKLPLITPKTQLQDLIDIAASLKTLLRIKENNLSLWYM
jgi:protease-4